MGIPLSDLKKKAAEKQKENATFLQKAAKKVPMKAVYKAHEEAFAKIDCLECANCCKQLGPRFKTTDIGRLAGKMKMRESVFIETYLRVDEDGDYVAKTLPCPFLGADNYCFIYEDRPGDCRKYPYTDSDVLLKRPKTTLANAPYCPAVFDVLEQLKKAFSR